MLEATRQDNGKGQTSRARARNNDRLPQGIEANNCGNTGGNTGGKSGTGKPANKCGDYHGCGGALEKALAEALGDCGLEDGGFYAAARLVGKARDLEAWARRRQAELRGRATARCRDCGRAFRPTRSGHIFCSSRCRYRYRRGMARYKAASNHDGREVYALGRACKEDPESERA